MPLAEMGITDGTSLSIIKRKQRMALTASGDGTAKIWDARAGVCKLTLSGIGHFVCSAVFSEDGSYVLTAGGSDFQSFELTALAKF